MLERNNMVVLRTSSSAIYDMIATMKKKTNYICIYLLQVLL